MKYIVLFLFLVSTTLGLSQDRKIDQLEILYDQGHYSKVIKKSSRLLANPAYDYSGLPGYYKSLALFRMANDVDWFKRHKNSIKEAISLYNNFLESERINDYLFSHYNEIGQLKSYLKTLAGDFKRRGLNGSADEIKAFVAIQLKDFKSLEHIVPITGTSEEPLVTEDKNNDSKSENSNFRDRLVVYAKSLVGVKYRWAGADLSGFDCSGFVGFVYKKYGIIIPRTASTQLASSKKIKLPDAQKGDLVFFSSGGNISHVGMVVSKKGDALAMVHASTSKGVIVTHVEKSTYWKPKLKAAGTYI